jgi:hypothetical protein
MAKSCKRKCKRHHKTMRNRKRRMQRGGELAGNPPSAWGYGLGTMGDGWTQFMNALTLQSNQNGNINQSNDIVPVGTIQNYQNMPTKIAGGRKKYRGGNQHTGSMPGPIPGPMPGSMPSSMPGSMPGSMPSSMPGSMPSSMPGSMPGSVSMPVSMPVAMPPKTGGKKRRTRGGNVVAQAIVPASLILMNNAFGKNSRKRN